MQNNSNRKGLALGAVFALVASLFAGSAPAGANESAVVAFPNVGTESQTTILADESFDLAFRFGNNVADALRNPASATAAGFGLIISKPAGVTVSATVSYAASANNDGEGTTSGTVATAGTEFVVGFNSSASPVLAIGLEDRTSVSAAVSITATPFLDLDGDEVRDNGETLGTPVTLTFAPWSALGAVLTLKQPVANDQGATASFTVQSGSINWQMLENNFTIEIASTRDRASGATASAGISGTNLSRVTAASASNVASGAYSASYTIGTAPFTTSGTVHSVSATLKYNSVELTKVLPVAVQAVAADGVTISAVTGPNAKVSGDSAAEARINSAFSVYAYAHSASVTTSIAVATQITVSAIANMELDADSGVVVNGVTYTSSAALLAAGFTLPSGTTTFAVSTFGQTETGTDTVTFKITQGLLVDDVVVTFNGASLNPVFTPTTVAGLAGSTKNFAVEVEDQWEQNPVRTDLRVAASVVLGGSTSETVSAAVVAGKASVAVTPTPATRTGSATVTFTLQRFDQDVQAWLNVGSVDTVTWNVYSYAAGTDAFVSRTASISASVSYVASGLTWSPTAIALTVVNSFSDVTVTAPGLMIQNVDDTTQTASDTLTVAANGKSANFKFTARKAGTYTVTFTNGTASTTSQVVVDAAADSAGSNITFDTTAIAAGSTKVITGTLVDVNGNPVHTSGSATILVTYKPTGAAGIPIGTMPTETDADGKFTITVLTGANDSGTAVVTAVYYKSGAATATADVLTFNQSIVVGGAASSAPSADQKLTVGSFKGYVAIYTLNYTGQKLSAKVAGKWLTVNNLSKFQRVVRNTGAGYTIKVDLYIDGAFVRSETVVTK